jgi:nickel-dependent lactate racemase
MEEVARRSGLKMIVNTILNPEEKIVKVVAGDVVAAHREGVRHSEKIYQFRIQERPDVVIAGSYPANKDLWQADKALAAAVLMVKPGGTVILAAPCFEGVCPEHPLLLELGAKPPREVYAMALRGEFEDPVAAATHIKIGVMREMAKVFLVSHGICSTDAEQMGLRSAKDLDTAIEEAFSSYGDSARIGVLTHGADSAPVVEE